MEDFDTEALDAAGKEYVQLAMTLKAFISEHLSAFVLVGYTENNERITIANSGSELESDALAALMDAITKDLVANAAAVTHLDDDGQEL